MQYGELIVKVSAASGSIPLEGALVTVYDAGGQGSGVIYTSYTDADGKSESFKLEAPARELSTSPENGGVRPYAVYNVEVKKNGYYDSFELEVPIFASVISVLPVNMIPLSEYESDEVRPKTGLVNTERESLFDNGGDE